MKLFKKLLPTLKQSTTAKPVLSLLFGLVLIIGTTSGIHTLQAASSAATKSLAANSISAKATTKITATPTTKSIVPPISTTKDTTTKTEIIKPVTEVPTTIITTPATEDDKKEETTTTEVEPVLPPGIKPAVNPIKAATPTVIKVPTTTHFVAPNNPIVPVDEQLQETVNINPVDNPPVSTTNSNLVIDSNICPTGKQILLDSSNASNIQGGWSDKSRKIVDEQTNSYRYTILNHNYPDTNTVQLDFDQQYVTDIYVLGFEDASGTIDIQNFDNGNWNNLPSLNLATDDWSSLSLEGDASKLRFTRNNESENIVEVILCSENGGVVDPPDPTTDPNLILDSNFCPSGKKIAVGPDNATMLTTAGWGDAEDLVDEQDKVEINQFPWGIFGHNSPETETVEITWPSSVEVTDFYVAGYGDADGDLDVQAEDDGQNVFDETIPLANDQWVGGEVNDFIDTIRVTRNNEGDNATEIIFCTAGNGNNDDPTGGSNGNPPTTGTSDPVEPETVNPAQCGVYGAGNRTRTVSKMIGTNSFVNNFNDDVSPGILREYRYLEKNLLDDGNVGINGQDGVSYTAANYEKFTYPAARGSDQVYPESPNEPIEYMPVIFGDVYRAENLPSDYELPEHYSQYEELIENAHQTYTEIPDAYTHHSNFLYQFVDKLKNHGPIAMNETGSWTVPVAEFNYIENNNESDKWWNGGHKGDHRGRFTPQEYAAMTSADYDGHCGTMGADHGIKDADQDLHMVMSGMARLYNEVQSEASDPLNRWKSPDQTGARWLEEFIEWSEENRGPGNLPIDAINFHIYPVHTDTDHSDGIDNVGVSPESYRLEEHINYFDDVRDNYNTQHGRNIELWFSEFGYTTTPKPAGTSFWMSYATHENSFKWLPRLFSAAFAQDIDMLNHFWSKDQGGNIWSLQAGLREENSDTKPTYYAVKAYTEALGDMRFEGKVQYCSDNGINVYAFKEPNSNKGAYAIWTGNEEELEYTLPLSVSNAEEIRIQYATSLNDIPHIDHTNINGSLDLNVNGFTTVVLVDQLNPALSYVNGDTIQSGSMCEGNDFSSGGTTSAIQTNNNQAESQAQTQKVTNKNNQKKTLSMTEKKTKFKDWINSLSADKKKEVLRKIMLRLKEKALKK